MHEMTHLDNLEELDGLRDDVDAQLAAPATSAQRVVVAVDRRRRPDDAAPRPDVEQRRRAAAAAAAAGRRRDEEPEAHDAEVGGGVTRPQLGVVDDVADDRSARNAFLDLVAQVRANGER